MARPKIELPGAFSDFMFYVEAKKQKAVNRPIFNGAPEVKQRLLKTFDAEENRLEKVIACRLIKEERDSQ